MGMYDNVICEYPLPDTNVELSGFQTKSLGCNLDTYKIDKDGQLFLKEYNSWWCDDEIFADEPSEWNICDYTGSIRFYTSAGSRSKHNYRWYEYIALFKHGKLLNIVKKVDEDF